MKATKASAKKYKHKKDRICKKCGKASFGFRCRRCYERKDNIHFSTTD